MINLNEQSTTLTASAPSLAGPKRAIEQTRWVI
jgi:hypothetical protein